MEVLKGNQSNRLGRLFPDYTWNYIADSILEGSMGKVLVNDKEDPQIAVLSVPEQKIHIMGGDAQHPAARQYLAELPGLSLLIIGAPGWPDLLNEVQTGKVISLKRYAFSSTELDPSHLNTLRSQLPQNFKMERIDLQCARQIIDQKDQLTEDQLFGFASAEDFIEHGFGYCVLEQDKMICIASTGAVCSKGIEVQINTHKKYRGQGLASAAGAALIIECLQNDIDPNWDAATDISAGLAEKLGYIPEGEYDVYYYTGSRFLVNLRNFLRWIRGRKIE